MSDNTPEQRPIEASNPRPEGESQASIRLVEKHPLAIRWMHWVNFPLLFMTGFAIYKQTREHLLTTMLGGYETAR